MKTLIGNRTGLTPILQSKIRLFPGIYLGLLLIIAVVASFAGCAGTQVQNKESLLSAAGFRKRTPSTQEQWAMYNRMTPYKLERNTSKGKALYTYADKQKGVIYIGGDKAYQRYRQLRIQQSVAEEELEASYSAYLGEMDRVWSVNYD
jgi:hypothetical protein